ncbi:MAG TPA: hypothetical protein VG245_10655, partial [Candidatus Dormibacteraeota bacterium]|nr:hypothetical protein [Candidatus Dormibacteraeota bacterium]
VWSAAPILVSGTSAYRAGEYLYQDFLYDDHGAAGTTRDPGDPRVSGDTFSMPGGTFTYPTGPGYNGNAADLVELRVRPLATATAFRVTLNTLVDSSLAAFTIAIGTPSSASAAYPHGAQSTGPADRFVTVHGAYADLIAAGAGSATALPAATVDTTRRQLEVRVPHTLWDPTGTTVRLSLGVGLWDRSTADGFAGRYLVPGQSATATAPGGLGLASAPSAFFNVGFRHAELTGQGNTDPLTGDRRWWRDAAQGQALKTGDMSPFHDDVDFTKLAAGTNDDMPGLPQGVPLTGGMDRILASHFETEQGVDYSVACGGNDVCKGELRGQLQPYSIYVPAAAPPASGYGLTLLLHSLAANYNQFLDSRNQSQFGDRGTGSIVITPAGRGPDGWYVDYAAADTFEVWADVAARYHLDPAYTAIAGYSMGGYGTFRLGTLYPDLFYKGQPTVGPPGVGIWVPPGEPTGGQASNTFHQLASLRNLPMLMWVMHTDELVPFAGTEYQAHQGFDALGLRYDFWAFAPGEHLTLAVNDQFQPAADWLGQGTVDRNPPHVTYVVNPRMAFPALGLETDHAYWLSGIALRDGTGTAPLGTVDVRSEGFGLGDPTPGGTQVGAGALTGGAIPSIAYARQYQDWSTAPATAVADRLDISATNVGAVTVDVARARVDCGVSLNITSDGPLKVTLAGCDHVVSYTPPVTGPLPNTGGGSRAPLGLAWLAVALALLAAVAARRSARVVDRP